MPAGIGSKRVARELFAAYGYQEIRVPIVEHTALFKRSIGEFTDIVQKEMFTFEDPGGDSLTLRPEATAGIVRAMISNGLLHNQRQRVWCAGPMFRYERPQAGRFRQFYQLDAEAFGFPGPDIDAELIMLSARLLRTLGLQRIELHLNSLGTPASRRVYREKLVEYFTAHKSRLDADSLRRLEGNPLRILDSKNPELQDVIAGAPVLTEYLDEESRQHFAGLCRHLDAVGIRYVLNPRLVRGLDYYTHTVFEWLTTELGSQGAVCSGGRYDGLVAQLGGESTPAIGWALGEERIVVAAARTARRDAGARAGRVLRDCRSSAPRPRAWRSPRRIRDAAAVGAHREQLRRRQLQIAVEARRQERGASGADSRRRGNRTPRRRSQVPASGSAAGRDRLGPGRGRDCRAARALTPTLHSLHR